MAKNKDYRLGWHVADEALNYGDKRKPKIGQALQMKITSRYAPEEPALCRSGMHASPTITEANVAHQLRGNRTLTLVLVFGKVTSSTPYGEWFKRGHRKFVGRYRVVLGRWSYQRVGQVFHEEAKELRAVGIPTGVFPHADWSDPTWKQVERRLLQSLGLEV